MFSNILVPTDGSALALAAEGKALDFAREAEATVIFLVVIEPFRVFSMEQSSSSEEDPDSLAYMQAARLLAEAEANARRLGVRCRSVAETDAQVHAAIIRVARDYGCDLIAIASHGRKGYKSLLLGSVTAKVLSHSRIPVLVYH